MIELVSLALAVVGLILAFETPRKWVVQKLRHWGILRIVPEAIQASHSVQPPPSPAVPISEALPIKSPDAKAFPSEAQSPDVVSPTAIALSGLSRGKGTPPENGVPERQGPISSVSVEEIIEAVNTSPLFQRDSIAAHYKGISVQWEGFLYKVEANHRRDGGVMIILTMRKSDVFACSIRFDEHPDKIPEIRTLHADSKIQITGTIESVSGPGLCVTVTPAKIVILERAPRAKSIARSEAR